MVRRVAHPDAPRLADLVDVDSFRADAVYRHARQGTTDPDSFAGSAALWEQLLQRGARSPAFRMVRGGTSLPLKGLTRAVGFGNRNLTDVAAPDRILDEYRGGATAVLQGLHITDPHLAKVAVNLALDLDQPIQVNAYLSPPHAQGLDLHYDYHDVFVVQLDGAKRWRVWAPLERTRNPSKSRPTEPLTLDELGSPLIDTVLRRGDTLYVPRGAPHAAGTVDEESVHLTVGMPSISWDRVVDAAARAEILAGGLTAPLPTNLLDGGAAAPLDQLDVQRLLKHLEPNVVRHWMAREIWRRQAATRHRPRLAAPESDGRRLRFTPGPLIWLTCFGRRAVLSYGTRRMELPAEAAPFLAALLGAADDFLGRDIAGLDDDSRRVVLARLVDEGILVAR